MQHDHQCLGMLEYLSPDGGPLYDIIILFQVKHFVTHFSELFLLFV